MKRKYLYLFMLVLICFTINSIRVIADTRDKTGTILSTFKKDISGDNQIEKIQIMKKFSRNKYEIQIIHGKDKLYTYPLKSTKKPNVIFQDLTQDGIKDIYISCSQKNGEQPCENLLLSFKNEQLSSVDLPKELMMVAQLQNKYQALIQITQTGQAYTLNLHSHQKSFDKRGLYQHGNLNEPTELMVHSFDSLKLIRFSDLSFGLVGKQIIDEGYNGDKIAYVNSAWKWVNGKWALQNTKVKILK